MCIFVFVCLVLLDGGRTLPNMKLCTTATSNGCTWGWRGNQLFVLDNNGDINCLYLTTTAKSVIYQADNTGELAKTQRIVTEIGLCSIGLHSVWQYRTTSVRVLHNSIRYNIVPQCHTVLYYSTILYYTVSITLLNLYKQSRQTQYKNTPQGKWDWTTLISQYKPHSLRVVFLCMSFISINIICQF